MQKWRLIGLGLAVAGCDAQGPDGPLWQQIQALAAPDGLPTPVDRSNKYALDPRAQALGHKLYFDPDFSGTTTLVDMLGRPVPAHYGRTAAGTPSGLSCASCHDPARGGADHTSLEAVSIGAGAYDVSSQPSTNAAYNHLFYWNGRNDSLWSQIVAVTESPVSMGGNRLRTMWRIADAYRAEYEAIFGPLPVEETLAQARARLDASGQCKLQAGACPSGCTADASGCWPRFPIEGRPGRDPGCTRGAAGEPFGDAFDCMSAEDRDLATRVYVDFSKAVAAYETTLVSQRSPFDLWVGARNRGEDGDDLLSGEAQRGAALFAGRASCAECHGGMLLTDDQFHDIGVPQEGLFVPTEDQCTAGGSCDCIAGRNCLPWGLYDGLSKLAKNGFRRDSVWSDDPTDTSRAQHYAIDLTAEDSLALRGRWKTPGLRDVAITAPYMHTGRYRTLREVLEHYNGGGHGSRYAKDAKMVPLGLSDADLDDLAAFLASLTGEPLPRAQVTAPELPPPSLF